MKICYLSNSAIPSDYASSIQIVKMCEAFAKLGNEVKLITRGDGRIIIYLDFMMLILNFLSKF